MSSKREKSVKKLSGGRIGGVLLFTSSSSITGLSPGLMVTNSFALALEL